MAYPDPLPRPGDESPVLLSKIAGVLSSANGDINPPKLGDSEQVLLFKIASTLEAQYAAGVEANQRDSEQVLLFKIVAIMAAQAPGLPQYAPSRTDEPNTLWHKLVNVMNEPIGGTCPPFSLDSDNTLQVKALKLFSGFCGGGN